MLHEIAFAIALALAPVLVIATDGTRQRLSAAVFAGSVVACFGASALYHRVTWSPRMRLWMRRIDHAGVYLLIAGTYTPVSLLALSGNWRVVVLAVVWSGAAAAIVLKFVWVSAPKWLAAAIGLALGWVAVVALPQLVSHLPATAVILLVVGGLAYSAGAIVYARRRPDPVPARLRLPRALSCADDRRRQLSVRCDRVLRRAPRLANRCSAHQRRPPPLPRAVRQRATAQAAIAIAARDAPMKKTIVPVISSLRR